MIEYFLEGSVPAKKNSKIFNTKTHRMFPSKQYQEWHDYAALMLRSKVTECITEKCKEKIQVILLGKKTDLEIKRLSFCFFS